MPVLPGEAPYDPLKESVICLNADMDGDGAQDILYSTNPCHDRVHLSQRTRGTPTWPGATGNRRQLDAVLNGCGSESTVY